MIWFIRPVAGLKVIGQWAKVTTYSPEHVAQVVDEGGPGPQIHRHHDPHMVQGCSLL